MVATALAGRAGRVTCMVVISLARRIRRDLCIVAI